MAPTFEKAKTCIFAEPGVWDREVGGSNPLAPTTPYLTPFHVTFNGSTRALPTAEPILKGRGATFFGKNRQKWTFFRDFAA